MIKSKEMIAKKLFKLVTENDYVSFRSQVFFVWRAWASQKAKLFKSVNSAMKRNLLKEGFSKIQSTSFVKYKETTKLSVLDRFYKIFWKSRVREAVDFWKTSIFLEIKDK